MMAFSDSSPSLVDHLPDNQFPTSFGSQNSNYWLTDSGASHNITSDLENLTLASPYQGDASITVGNGHELPITHSGHSLLVTPSYCFKLNNVLRVPAISANLISVKKFCQDNHCLFMFDSNSFIIQDKATKQVLYGKCSNALYPIVGVQSSSSSPAAFLGTRVTAHTWHDRLGHPSSPVLHQILSKSRIPYNKSGFHSCQCTQCLYGKMSKQPFPVSTTFSASPLHILHSDVWGPAPHPSIHGYKY